jgi:hypothetical protein
MVYGRNIGSLEFERKYHGTKVPSIEVVSFNPDAKNAADRILEATWPVAKQKGLAAVPGADSVEDVEADASAVADAEVTSVDPSGKTAEKETLRISVPGFSDKTRLLGLARQIYEEVGRGELGGKCSSKDLASIGGDNDDADMLRLTTGDAVEFFVDATGMGGFPPIVSELTLQAESSPQAAVQYAIDKLGIERDLATVIVGTARGSFAKLQTTFRVNTVKFTWDVQTGIAVDFDFQNYIEARADVEKHPAKTLSTAATTKTTVAASKAKNPAGRAVPGRD